MADFKDHAETVGTADSFEKMGDHLDEMAPHLREAGQHQLLRRMRADVIGFMKPERVLAWTKEKWQEELRAL